MIEARSWSQEVVSWVLTNYRFVTEDDAALENFYWTYLAWQARAICHAKDFGESNKAYSYTEVPIAKRVRGLVTECFKGVDEFRPRWETFSLREPDSFALPGIYLHEVEVRESQKKGMSFEN